MPDSLPVIPVGFFGCGVVGSGTLLALQQNAAAIERQLGARLEVRRVCVRDPHRARPVELAPEVLTTEPAAILDDPCIQVVVELMGGVQPAGDYLLRALRGGKHVVTANKELVAKEGPALFAAAAQQGLDFFCEGSVAGGIPILRALQVSLAGNRFSELIGIVNGTTNYILTQMAQTGKSFDQALSEAQALGFAEADPTDDVDGFDAVYKLAILASMAFGTRVPLDRVARQGIRNITDRDIAYARQMGYVIKLLAIARRQQDGLELRVHPGLLRVSHPLASVNDVYNAVFAHGHAVGEVMFFGRGAGSLPTGSSVLGDLMEVARGIRCGGSGRVRSAGLADLPILPIEDAQSHYYVRTETADRPGVLAAVAGVFGKHGVSLESMLQKRADEQIAEIVWITHRTREGRLQAALREIEALPVVQRVSSCIRVEE